ncbi:MAG: C-GCAxxG-C-C family (seleno)protein [Spirochaetia bacterium]
MKEKIKEKKSDHGDQSIVNIVKDDLHLKEDLNCAESILCAANEAYAMELPRSACKLAAGFGGGMGIESVCGVVTGGVMALSSLFVVDRGHESDYIKTLTSEFIEEFYRHYGSLECKVLKEKHRTPLGDCKPIILEGAHILQKIIEREGRNIK